MSNKKNINIDYQKDFLDYLKLIVDQQINSCFYFIEDQGKSKKLCFIKSVLNL